MKFGKLILLAIVLSFWNIAVRAQCDQTIKVSFKSVRNEGEIDVRLSNAERYTCILYVYEFGEKNKVSEISGSSILVQFKNLPLARFYSVEFSFKDRDDLFCSSWVSELIQFDK
jgi:hypothetical protein